MRCDLTGTHTLFFMNSVEILNRVEGKFFWKLNYWPLWTAEFRTIRLLYNFVSKELLLARLHKKITRKVSRPRPKSFETETRPETFETETETWKNGLKKLETRYRDSITARLQYESLEGLMDFLAFLVQRHGPCRRFRGDQNDEDTRTFCGKFFYKAIASTDNAQHKNCPSSGIDDRPGKDLFRVLKRSPISKPHTLGLRRGYSDGKAVGNTTGLRRSLHPHWKISLLQSLRWALGQTEASFNFWGLGTTRPRFEPHEQRPTRHEASALTTRPHVLVQKLCKISRY